MNLKGLVMKKLNWQVVTVACVAMIMIGVAEIVALCNGINGQVFTTSVALIAGIGAGVSGFKLGRK